MSITGDLGKRSMSTSIPVGESTEVASTSAGPVCAIDVCTALVMALRGVILSRLLFGYSNSPLYPFARLKSKQKTAVHQQNPFRRSKCRPSRTRAEEELRRSQLMLWLVLQEFLPQQTHFAASASKNKVAFC